MVGKVDYSSVPTTVELENNSNQKKYTINKGSSEGLVISKPLCTLMGIGALLLAILVGLVVFFMVPRCDGDTSPEAFTKTSDIFTQNLEDDVDERLPRNVEPSHYRIHIKPNFENSTTSGHISMTLKTITKTEDIIFHVKNITIDADSVKIESLGNSSQIKIIKQEYVEGDKYKITLKDALDSNKDYVLDFDFNGELNGHLQGFYLSRYSDLDGKRKYVASTQFSPTDARRAFPCFDEPSFKAKFTISLARPSNMTTLSNMPLSKTSTISGEENWFWDHYPETPTMPTYLVAFMVSDLDPAPVDNTLIKVWSNHKFLPYTAYALDLAPKILEYFENYFQIKFPLPKIDIVAVPEFGFSAMENWGLITFRESSLLWDPEMSTNDDRRNIATVLSHEIAHQWFGNLVTPKWWNDLWLKEGFATYMEYFGVDHANQSWKIVEEFLLSETERAMATDALETSRPISFEVKNSKQIRQTFDDISYSKGACIIRMMNHFLGEQAFRNGLINYLKKYQYKNADRQDLFASLTEEAHKHEALLSNETVKVIMDTWTERPGFPVIYSMANYETNKLHLSQKRFYLSGKNEKSSWWVPLSFTSENNANFVETKPKFWLRGQYEIEEEVNLKNSKWYLLNINATGYFIVNYDERNWKALSDNIMDLPPLTRAQLISDSMDLARANFISYEIPLKMIARMAVLDEQIMIIPTIVALDKLKFLNNILGETPAFGLFQEYHRTIFRRTYERVTFDVYIDDYITHRIRSKVLEWSCRSSDSRCTLQSRTQFRKWMISGTKVDPNLRQIVYCTAVREGGEMEWEFTYKQYLNTHAPSEKNMLLDALGCTKLKWLLSRYIENLNNVSSIRIQDADRVFESVAKNQVGTSIAFDFLRKNWISLLNRYGDGFNILARMIKSLSTHMNTEFQLSELQRFRDSIKNNISTTAFAFNSAIEIVKSNVDWMEKNYQQVEDWLREQKDHFSYL